MHTCPPAEHRMLTGTVIREELDLKQKLPARQEAITCWQHQVALQGLTQT